MMEAASDGSPDIEGQARYQMVLIEHAREAFRMRRQGEDRDGCPG